MKKNILLFAILLLTILASLAKLFFLDKTPLFGDEALYCYLGYNFTQQSFASALNITVNHWKDAPGLIIFNAVNFALFGQSSPIYVCRFTSIFFSSVALITFWQLIKLLTANQRIQVVSFLFLLLNPFNFFFDRTSLMDAPLVSFVLLFFYFSLRFLKNGKPWNLLSALISFTCMFLTKFNSLLILPVIASFTLFQQKVYPFRKKYYISVGLLLAMLIVVTYYFTRTWETVFYHIDDSVSVIGVVFRVIRNSKVVLSWYLQFLTPLSVILMFVGFIILIKKKYFPIVFLLPLLLFFYVVISLRLFPRYLLFTLPFVSILVGFGANNRLGIIVFTLLVPVFLWNDFLIVVNPAKARIAKETHYQYFTDWSSGIGTRKVIQYLSQQKDNAFITILIPIDLEGLFSVTRLAYAPMLKTRFKFIENSKELIWEIEQSEEKDILIITTPNHEWITSSVKDFFQAKIIYASNGNNRNSVLIYEI